MILYLFQIAVQFSAFMLALRMFRRYQTYPWIFLSASTFLMTARRLTALLIYQGKSANFVSITLSDTLFLPSIISLLLISGLYGLSRVQEIKEQSIELEEDLYENAPFGIVEVWPDGRIKRVNQYVLNLWGLSLEFVLSQLFTWMKITPAEDLEKDLELLQKLRNKEIDSYELCKRYKHSEGFLCWAKIKVWRVERFGILWFFRVFIEDLGPIVELEELIQSLQEKLSGTSQE